MSGSACSTPRALRLASLLPLLVLVAGFGSGCASEEPEPAVSETPPPAAAPAAAPGPEPGSEAPGAGGEAPLVVFLGDSLTAGLGLPEDEAYPARVAAALDESGVEAEVLNAGVSGDTTAGGLARLDWLLAQDPEVVVVALGANDGLRGLSLSATEENLRRIVERSREAGARVVLAGMKLPPNYGPEYTRGFAELYPRLAEELDVPLVPFLLEGVGGVRELNQADGIHPNTEGQERVAEVVLPYLMETLEGLDLR